MTDSMNIGSVGLMTRMTWILAVLATFQAACGRAAISAHESPEGQGKPRLVLLLARYDEPHRDLAAMTLAWMADGAGADFDVYYAGDHQEGGLFAPHGSTMIGGQHALRMGRALAAFRTTVVRLGGVSVFASMVRSGAEQVIDAPGDLPGLYATFAKQLGLDLPAVAVAFDTGEVPLAALYYECVQRKALALPLSLPAEQIERLRELGVSTVWTVAKADADVSAWKAMEVKPALDLGLADPNLALVERYLAGERFAPRGVYCFGDHHGQAKEADVPGAAQLALWKAVKDAGFDYLITSVLPGDSRILYRDGDFVVLNQAGRWHSASTFVRGDPATFAAAEKNLAEAGRPGWLVGAVDCPIHGSPIYVGRPYGGKNPQPRINEFYDYVQRGGATGKVLPATPRTIARHARLIADRSQSASRCLYSKNVPNLFIAGRNISVTHAGLAPVRVMNTTGMMGTVVGRAAYLCRRHGVDPRGLYERHLDDFKRLLTDPRPDP